MSEPQVHHLLSKDDESLIIEAIKSAEHRTSGEIRVHIEDECETEALDRAQAVFAELKMHKTKLRNGVLIYVAIDNRKLAIFGDTAIHDQVGQDFWNDVRDQMIREFRKGKYAQGIAQGVKMAGEKLRTHFPWQSDDKNELSDEISYKNESD
ncbi:MAG TPA: TPM domain-containing protein [Balneolales bacterium]|nr:TPM domain-containing protein [Balneolales bacterium]